MINTQEIIPPLKRELQQQVLVHQQPFCKTYSSQGNIANSLENKKFQSITQLEIAVSIIQEALEKILKIRSQLVEIKDFLQTVSFKGGHLTMPETVINNFLNNRIWEIRSLALEPDSRGRSLLNGNFGVTGLASGDRLSFVRGSGRVVSSADTDYQVAVFKTATRASLKSFNKITPEKLREEKLISVFEGANSLRYQIADDETPESLVTNLQKAIKNNGMDILVLVTGDNHLLLVHNQYGSIPQIAAVSYRTNLISEYPAQLVNGIPGEDIQGCINGESAGGNGAFMIGCDTNKTTAGMVVHFDGEIKYPWQSVGRVRVQQNGISLPADEDELATEIFVLPSLLPTNLAVGVTSSSGLKNLACIKGSTPEQCYDSMKMVFWVLEDLDDLIQNLKNKEKNYIERALAILRASMTSEQTRVNQPVYFSQKAKEMSDEIENLLNKRIS